MKEKIINIFIEAVISIVASTFMGVFFAMCLF